MKRITRLLQGATRDGRMLTVGLVLVITEDMIRRTIGSNTTADISPSLTIPLEVVAMGMGIIEKLYILLPLTIKPAFQTMDSVHDIETIGITSHQLMILPHPRHHLHIFQTRYLHRGVLNTHLVSFSF
jgi:hypothetical protein